jgi:catechol 2,3-dioxygenase-like lactoylglutathione lyase family enzyme
VNIIDHLSVGVPSIKQGTGFYDALLEKLGCSRLACTEDFAAYGKDAVQFLLMVPSDGKAYSAGNGTHIALLAPSKSAVDAFYVEGINNGGIDEGGPGPRAAYPKSDVYTAFVRDPFGNKLEAIYNGFAAAEAA